MKSPGWRYLVYIFVVASCFGAQLDAKGCRLLAILCRKNPNCDYRVRCGQYVERTKRTGDAIPPMSLLPEWPFFLKPDPHQKTVVRNPRFQRYPSYHKAKQLAQRYSDYGLKARSAENRGSDRYENEATDEWTGGQRMTRNSEGLKDRIYLSQGDNVHHDYHTGAGRHSDDVNYLYSSIARLTKLKEALDWREANDRGATREKHALGIERQEQTSIYDPYESKQIDNSIWSQATAEDGEGGRSEQVETRRTDDYLKPAEDIASKESSHLRQTDYLQEQQIRPLLEDSSSNSAEENAKISSKSVVRVKQSEEEAELASQEENRKPVEFYAVQTDKSPVVSKDQKKSADSPKYRGTLILHTASSVDPKTLKSVGGKLQRVLWGSSPSHQIFSKISLNPDSNKDIYLRMQVPSNVYSAELNPNTVVKRINTDASLRNNITKATGLTVVRAGISHARPVPFAVPKDKNWDEFAIITAIVGGCTLGLIVASVLICSLKRRSKQKKPIELQKKEAFSDYEELCRTQMAVNTATSPRAMKAIQDDRQRHGLVNGQGKVTKKNWREEPLAYNMDITTGHVILGYLEEHLKDENKLSKEWDALCNYKADQDETSVGEESKNASKNRYSNVVPYDHSRVKLRETANIFHSDYINASYITDADPRNPSYIATQGPLDNTVADFWQMIWEQGVVVIVNLTRLSDMGLPQCHRYWPEEGSEVYNTYQVHLISEHIWCDDYIVRSFYLKHLVTAETRTVTQFHFLTWPDLSVPESAKPVLEFRRKVNKCYRGQACPIVVHCNNGIGRSGTYILIDMVLKKMIKGTKEIDIAATLEHLRDQRPDMVKTKAQFEFTLASVAEEITAILSSLSG